jgi:hypothetical protein
MGGECVVSKLAVEVKLLPLPSDERGLGRPSFDT